MLILVLYPNLLNVSLPEKAPNNTNKLSPQERTVQNFAPHLCSNNTNKLSPQEHIIICFNVNTVQIIQINLVLKNIEVGEVLSGMFK